MWAPSYTLRLSSSRPEGSGDEVGRRERAGVLSVEMWAAAHQTNREETGW